MLAHLFRVADLILAVVAMLVAWPALSAADTNQVRARLFGTFCLLLASVVGAIRALATDTPLHPETFLVFAGLLTMALALPPRRNPRRRKHRE